MTTLTPGTLHKLMNKSSACAFGLILVSILTTSCATLVARKNYKLHVSSNRSGDKIEIDSTIYNLPARLKVKRAKTPLKIKLISDSTIINYTVLASPNPAFVYGNLFWMQLSPAAYLIDMTNQRRFYYGKSVFLNSYDSSRVITPFLLKGIRSYFSREYPWRKGQINLLLSLPHINTFYMKPAGEGEKVNTGFWGFSAGLQYVYKNNRYVSFSASAVTDFFVPIPAAVDIEGESESMGSVYVSLTDNLKIKRFHIGYGISFSRNTWRYDYVSDNNTPPPSREPIVKSDKSLGLVFNAFHQITQTFLIGVIYRPTLLKVSPVTRFSYEHLISFDLGWRIRLKK